MTRQRWQQRKQRQQRPRQNDSSNIDDDDNRIKNQYNSKTINKITAPTTPLLSSSSTNHLLLHETMSTHAVQFARVDAAFMATTDSERKRRQIRVRTHIGRRHEEGWALGHVVCACASLGAGQALGRAVVAAVHTAAATHAAFLGVRWVRHLKTE